MRRLTVAGATVALTATLSGCFGGAVSAHDLARAVGLTYQRLYVVQQHELGHADVTPPDDTAACTRSGARTQSGSGSWVCTVHYPYPDGHLIPLSFDVEVQPTGCYTATGPPAVVGQRTVTTPAGGSVTNPLFAFDGCFRTG